MKEKRLLKEQSWIPFNQFHNYSNHFNHNNKENNRILYFNKIRRHFLPLIQSPDSHCRQHQLLKTDNPPICLRMQGFRTSSIYKIPEPSSKYKQRLQQNQTKMYVYGLIKIGAGDPKAGRYTANSVHELDYIYTTVLL